MTTVKSTGRKLEFDPDRLGLGMILRKAYFSVRRCSNSLCTPWDCNGDQFVLLKLLADEGGLTQKDLVERAGYDASTTATMLKRLERNGLIERKEHPNDARAKQVSLTQEGNRVQKKLWKQSETLRHRLWNCLPPENRALVLDTLERIATEMNDYKTELES